MLGRGPGEQGERKFLSIKSCLPVDIRRLKEFLATGRPEQAEGKVTHFLELAKILESRVKNSEARANARFSRSSRQFRKQPFRRCGGIGQAEARRKRGVLGWSKG